jgi:predicted AAA+ superfamily ATPase
MGTLAKIIFLRADLAGLSVFSNIKTHPLLRAFDELLAVYGSSGAGAKAAGVSPAAKEPLALCGAWAAFTGTFVRYAQITGGVSGDQFYEAVACLTLGDDNPFTRAAELLRGKPAQTAEIPALLKILAVSDLDRLGRIADADIAGLGFHIAGLLRESGHAEAAKNIEAEARMLWADEGAASADNAAGYAGNNHAPAIFPRGVGWGESLPRFIAYIAKHGAGDLSRGCFFFWRGGQVAHNVDGLDKSIPPNSPLLPVHSPDPVCLADLAGYESQRTVVIANTLRFIEGKGANNLLLYGDRGTGKSATVKAVCGEYAEKGLRLVEVRKSDLFELPRILDTLAARALRFVLFIDDLSFEVIDDSFTCLKALLEGGVETRPSNVVIYATSNRRHLVKERLADRPSLAQAAADSNGEVRAFETMQEQFSLADRFGISLVFTAPGQEEYLLIAEHIARRRGFLRLAGEISPAETAAFRENALRWEKWFNGRSPRTAVQYVDWCAGGANFPWE